VVCKPQDIVRYPDRFVDKREREDGMRHWNRLMALIEGEDDGRSADYRHGDAAALRQKAARVQSAMGTTSSTMD
jgi:hypothetical protein